MTVRRLLLDALDARWRDYRDARKACRRKLAPDSVHDLRVAARRLLALLALARSAAPAARTKRLRKLLKAQLHAFDALRDTQVMLSVIPAATPGQAKLRRLLERLADQEQDLQAQAGTHLQASCGRALARKVASLRKAIADAPCPQPSVLEAVDQAYEKVTARHALLPPLEPAAIHRLRITFKGFRYLAEIAAPVIPAFPEALPRRLHDCQTAMGEVQDAEILVTALNGFACPPALRRFAEDRRATALAAFDAVRCNIATFWRADPHAAFPWEEKHEPVSHPARSRGRSGRQARQRARAD